MADKVRINFDVDAETAETLKTLAGMKKQTMSKFIVGLINAYAEKNADTLATYKKLQGQLKDL